MKTRGGDWVLAAIVGGSLLALLVQSAFSVPEWQAGPADGGDSRDRRADDRRWSAQALLGVRVDALGENRSARSRYRRHGGLFVAV